MGKVRRGRQKLHLQAVKSDDQKDKEHSADSFKLNESILPAIFPVKGLFGNSGSSENKVEDDTKKKTLSKLGKRKERHQRFLNKLNASRVVDDTVKKSQERAKTVIVGDLHPMLSALPTVKSPDIKQDTASERKNGKNPRGSKSKMARKKMQLADLEQFKQVLSHPAYKANPLGAISEHLKNAVHMEQENKT